MLIGLRRGAASEVNGMATNEFAISRLPLILWRITNKLLEMAIVVVALRSFGIPS